MFSRLSYAEERVEEAINNADSVENQGRKLMLEVDGIPLSDDETENTKWCQEIIEKICDMIGEPALKDDIDIAHRLFNNRIIVLFKNRTSRNTFYYSRFNLKGKNIKDLNFDLAEGKKGLIWINESLTNKRRKLLSKTKEELKKVGFNIGKEGIGLYTSLGNIKINANKKVFNISSENDIHKSIFMMKKALKKNS